MVYRGAQSRGAYFYCALWFFRALFAPLSRTRRYNPHHDRYNDPKTRPDLAPTRTLRGMGKDKAGMTPSLEQRLMAAQQGARYFYLPTTPGQRCKMVRMVKNITPQPGDRYMLPSGNVVEVIIARAPAHQRVCVYVQTAQGCGIKPGDRCELTVGFLQTHGELRDE